MYHQQFSHPPVCSLLKQVELDRADLCILGDPSMRRIKSCCYKKTDNLQACQLLSGTRSWRAPCDTTTMCRLIWTIL